MYACKHNGIHIIPRRSHTRVDRAWRDKNLYGADKTNDKCTFHTMGSDQSNLIISANKSKYACVCLTIKQRDCMY